MIRVILLIIMFMCSSFTYASDINFSAGFSKISLRQGQEILTLEDNAAVQVDTLNIKADEIILSGDDYSIIECNGNIVIDDEEKDISIKTRKIFYNRETERLIISSYSEIEDFTNEFIASASSINYDMKNNVLALEVQVNLVKITDEAVLKITADKVIYDTENESILLQGSAKVKWGEDDYSAEVISIDLETDEIKLEGGITGVINA